MTNEEFDAIMEGTVKELATQQSWLDKQKDNVDHIYKLLRELKELEGQLRREREELALERDEGLEQQLSEAQDEIDLKSAALTGTSRLMGAEIETLRGELAKAQAALRNAYQECATICVEVAEDIPRDATVWWTAAAQKCCDCIERQAATLKAAREAKE